LFPPALPGWRPVVSVAEAEDSETFVPGTVTGPWIEVIIVVTVDPCGLVPIEVRVVGGGVVTVDGSGVDVVGSEDVEVGVLEVEVEVSEVLVLEVVGGGVVEVSDVLVVGRITDEEEEVVGVSVGTAVVRLSVAISF